MNKKDDKYWLIEDIAKYWSIACLAVVLTAVLYFEHLDMGSRPLAVLLGVIAFLIALPAKYDPAIRLKEWSEEKRKRRQQ